MTILFKHRHREAQPKRSRQKCFISGLLRRLAPRNDRMRQSGNAVLFILIAVALFGALSYTFMRGSKSGQGNLSANQARIAAQELVDFFGKVEKATNKLRARGCSESDISFASPTDTGTFIAHNKPATAPVDGSCDVFLPAGAGLTMNMDWTRYQIPLESNPQPQYHGQMRFRQDAYVANIGTSPLPEITITFDYLRPEICDAYNKIMGFTVDMTVYDQPGGTAPTAIGLINTTLAGKYTACFARNASLSKLYLVWSPR